MIRQIRVNGFRSLINFEIELSEGLNVLVGPNGTGKSNFISFLDFVGVLLQNGLNPAIAVAQGAGSVFSKEMFLEDSAQLEFSISGTTDTRDAPTYLHVADNAKGLVEYRYRCRINYQRTIPAVYVSYESIEVSISGKNRLEIIRSTEISEGGFSSDVSILPKNHAFAKTAFRWMRPSKGADFDVRAYLISTSRPDASILRTLASDYEPVIFILKDVMGYRSINIDPTIARKPTPVGSSSRLQPTGEGLAGVLYQLQQGTYQPGSSFYYRPPEPGPIQKTRFESIMSWCREVNPDIARVGVELDFHEAQLKPSMTFQFGDALETFPMSRISDGTVKWLTLASILFLNEDLSVIEEPENFLHPFMQETFIGLCRHVLHDSTRFVVISTHSPTLLDCCSPSELTIFETVGGHTRASRVKNREELATKIKNSRFGLGYFYRTGGLYGADRSDG